MTTEAINHPEQLHRHLHRTVLLLVAVLDQRVLDGGTKRAVVVRREVVEVPVPVEAEEELEQGVVEPRELERRSMEESKHRYLTCFPLWLSIACPAY